MFSRAESPGVRAALPVQARAALRRRSAGSAKSRAAIVACALLACGVSQTSHAQDVSCGLAVSQLQQYVAQVNSFANGEFYQGIPMRCGPDPMCAQWWLGQLNAWYMQQTSLVNGWYSRISQQCSQQPAPSRVPSRRQTDSQPGELDEGAIEDLEVDDEDRTVRIRIPSTPSGYR